MNALSLIRRSEEIHDRIDDHRRRADRVREHGLSEENLARLDVRVDELSRTLAGEDPRRRLDELEPKSTGGGDETDLTRQRVAELHWIVGRGGDRRRN
jgi:hypothetical protein